MKLIICWFFWKYWVLVLDGIVWEYFTKFLEGLELQLKLWLFLTLPSSVNETDQLLIFFLSFLQGNVLQVWKVFTTLSASSRARARRAKILEIEDWEAGFSFSSYRIMKQTFLRRTVASKTSCSSLGTVFKIEKKLPAKISTFLSKNEKMELKAVVCRRS